MAILIVDDRKDTRTMIKRILEMDGHPDILMAESAAEAFALLGAAKENPAGSHSIDLILMDLMMPVMNGIDACRQIRAQAGLGEIPIIMVTANTDIQRLQESFEAGANDYINKPFNRIELLARVRSALRLKEETDRRKAREQELLEVKGMLEAANKVLKRLSSLDGLTGIRNRRAFNEALVREWRRGFREKKPLSLIMIDIDQFKCYNDAYGHQAGDECLKRVARALDHALHRPGDVLARYGGEEFAAVLPDTHLDGAVHVAEYLREAINKLNLPHAASTTESFVTISLGVGVLQPEPSLRVRRLVELADRALYLAKQAGRNCVKALDGRTGHPSP